MKRIFAIAFCLASFVVPSAYANCGFWGSPATIDFGSYSAFSTATTTATGGVILLCFGTAGVTIELTRGTSSTFVPRVMANGAERLQYNLFTDAAGTRVWGDGTGGSVVYNVPSGFFVFVTIYARLPGGQDAAVGVFTDSIVLSIVNPGNNVTTRTFQVLATVVPECMAVDASLPFGNYEPIVANATAPRDAASAVNVYCTKGTIGSMGIGYGLYASGTTRRMRSGSGDHLLYDVFTNAARTTLWTPSSALSRTSTSKNTPLGGGVQVYGRIPPGQDVSVGTYGDTLQAVVNY